MSQLSPSSQRVLHGSCLCEAVRYSVHDEFEYALICHCSQCRRATGSAFKPFGGIAREKLTIVQGENDMHRYGDDLNHDAHCRTCGSLLYSVVRDGQYVHVTYGTLADTPTLLPTVHIHVGSKAPWFTIADDLPQYQQFD